jgi:hypothetical protein
MCSPWVPHWGPCAGFPERPGRFPDRRGVSLVVGRFCPGSSSQRRCIRGSRHVERGARHPNGPDFEKQPRSPRGLRGCSCFVRTYRSTCKTGIAKSAYELCLELPRPLDRRNHLIGRGRRSFEGDARLLLDSIRRSSFHACKPLQGLFHFSLAAASGHAGDGEYQLLAVGHVILLVVVAHRVGGRF